MPDELIVTWSSHALDRGRERLIDPAAVIVPYRLICQFAPIAIVGAKFKVISDEVSYLCRKVSENRVVIVTVWARVRQGRTGTRLKLGEAEDESVERNFV